MSQILKTKDYSIFKKHPSNREIDLNNLKKIKFSLEMHNLLELKPVIVDSSMRIIDGQHRVKACEELGIEVCYQISKDAQASDILNICAAQKNWQTDDYINYYISLGNEDYKKISDYCKKRNITHGEFNVYLFSQGDTKGDKNRLRKGLLKFPNPEELAKLDELLDRLNDVMCLITKYLITQKNIVRSRNLRHAVLSMLKNPDLNFQTFLDRLTRKAESLRMCTSTSSYYALLREIYNYRNPNPID